MIISWTEEFNYAYKSERDHIRGKVGLRLSYFARMKLGSGDFWE